MRDVRVSRCQFRDCRQSRGSGGAVRCEPLLAVHFESSLFERCSAPDGSGGALYAVARAIHLSRCTASLCDSVRGFFLFTRGNSLSLARCEVSECRGDSPASAGAIYTDRAAAPSLTDLNLTRGNAATAGAALYFAPDVADATRNSFLTVTGCAGPNAVAIAGRAFGVEDSRFADNAVGPAGCVLHAGCADGAYAARRCVFAGNGALAAGGPGRFAFADCAMERPLLLEEVIDAPSDPGNESVNESYVDSDSDWTTASAEESESETPSSPADLESSPAQTEAPVDEPSSAQTLPGATATVTPVVAPPSVSKTIAAATQSVAAATRTDTAAEEPSEPDTQEDSSALASPNATLTPPQSTGLPVTPRTSIAQSPLATDPDWLHQELVSGLSVMMVLFVGGAVVIIVVGVVVFCCCCRPKLRERAVAEPSSCEDKEDLESLFMSTATTKNFLSQHQDGIIETTAATQAYDAPTIPIHTEEDDIAW